jgi:hypothetical protein
MYRQTDHVHSGGRGHSWLGPSQVRYSGLVTHGSWCINTSTTIITFLMVFLIQNTQNRDTEALQIKLDELIRSQKEANNALLDLEELDDDELDRIRAVYMALARHERREHTSSGWSRQEMSMVFREYPIPRDASWNVLFSS